MAAEPLAAETVATTAPSSLSGGSEDSAATRRLGDLRVIDLRAELKRRNLDAGGNKSVLLERLRKAIEDEGGDPEEVPVPSEVPPKKTPKRSSKGRRPEEEGVDDNGLEDDSGDGQEDIGASLDNLQDMDMMDISVLDEAETDNSSGVDGQEEEESSADPRLDSLSDRQDPAGAERPDIPGQLAESPVGNAEAPPHLSDVKEEAREILAMTEGEEAGGRLDLTAANFANVKDSEECPAEPENEKILDILGDTCKSEPLKEEEEEDAEEPSEVEQMQEKSTLWIGKPAADEEEEALSPAAQPDEEPLDSESPAGWAAANKKEEEEGENLGVAKEKRSEQRVEEAELDSDSLAVESRSGGGGGGGESSRGTQAEEASSEVAVEMDAGPQAASPEAEKMEAKANGEEESSATREPSAPEGADQNTSSNEDAQHKSASKYEKGRLSSSSGRNLWVSGLSSSTRATDLKNLFSKYGKVVGAKVVTNARSPGARCYGFVTMSSSEEATKCIAHLHRTELHGRMISVERAKNEPAGKKLLSDKKENEVKKERDRRHSADSRSERSLSLKKDEKADRKDEAKKPEEKSGGEKKEGKTTEEEHKARSVSRLRSTKSASRGTERTVVMDKSKGEPVISVKTSSTSKERSTKSQDCKSESKEKQDILSFDKIKEQRERERQRQWERELRESERRRERDQRLQAAHEWDERQRLERERERLHFQRQRLERERLERERLERQRLRIEQERRREQERIQREREELRRQHEQLRYEQARRSNLRRPYDGDRRDDSYWPEAKRMAMDDRYHSDFRGQERFHSFEHRDRGRYQDHTMDRRESSRSLSGGNGQRYPDDRHGSSDRPSRESWGGYGPERRLSKGRGLPPSSRDSRDWDHGRKIESHPGRSWPSNADGEMMGREHERWEGGERSVPGQSGSGHVMHREGIPGRTGFAQGGTPDPGSGGPGSFAGQERPSRPSFTRHY